MAAVPAVLSMEYLPVREEESEGEGGDQGQLEPGVEEVGQDCQDHQGHSKEHTNSSYSKFRDWRLRENSNFSLL